MGVGVRENLMRRRRIPGGQLDVGFGFEYNRRPCCDEEKDGEGNNQSLPELLEAAISEFRDIFFSTNLSFFDKC